MKNEIEIKGNKYEVRSVFSAVLEFEEQTGKIVEKTLKDQTTMMYLNLKKANKGKFDMSFDEFVELIDEDLTVYTKLADLFARKTDTKK